MAYTVGFTPQADRQLGALPPKVRERLIARAERLAEEPRGPGVVKLKGKGDPPVYRVWVGRAYRLLFTVDDQARQVEVVACGPRKDVYRRR